MPPEGIRTAKLGDEATERFVRLRSDLGITSFGINQIVLAPGQRNRIHRHSLQEEVYLVLDGTLTLLVEGEPLEFAPGEIVAVAPSVRRQLVNRSSKPVSMLALGGMVGHEHVPRDAEAFLTWADTEPGTPQTVPLPDDLPAEDLR